MSLTSEGAATIWNESGWPEYYETHRATTADVYPSEWFFLKDLLAEGMTVLDIGSAAGGLASVLSEHLHQFEYTGVDISEEMVRRARQRHPTRTFHVIREADLAAIGDGQYDVVVCLGVLHLTRPWRELVASAWQRTKQSLLLDLRESHLATVEDETASHFRVDFLLNGGSLGGSVLPYNIINSAEALSTIVQVCADAGRLQHYGYLAPPSEAAVTPVKQVLMNTYRIDRRR